MMVLVIIGVMYLAVMGGLTTKNKRNQTSCLAGKSAITRLFLILTIPILIVASLTVISLGFIIAVVLAPFVIVSAGLVLTINGGVMLRRESVSLGNSLSLLLGVGLLGVSLANLVAHVTRLEILKVLVTSANGVSLIVLASFLIFLIVAYVTQRHSSGGKADYLIILGSGLVDNQVTPLLKSRLDRGIELYQQQSALGQNSRFVVTGGQGADEAISEGEAMKNYLVLQGIDSNEIIVENKAVNTYENMLFSKGVIEKECADYQAIFVSNNFHVFRSRLFAKQVGLAAKGVGSQTASYYLPSAMLREFVAVSLMAGQRVVRSLTRAPREAVSYK